MEQGEPDDKRTIRHRGYDRVAQDIKFTLRFEVSHSNDYLERLEADLCDSDSYGALLDIFDELRSDTLADELYFRDEFPDILVSKAFREGFVVGLDINRRLMGNEFDQATNEHVVDAINHTILQYGGNVTNAMASVASLGVYFYNNNYAHTDEPDAREFNKLENPLDEIIDIITSELYFEGDDTNKSLFKQGYGIVRRSQLIYQKKIDEEFAEFEESYDSTSQTPQSEQE